jgi:hypothetical protein
LEIYEILGKTAIDMNDTDTARFDKGFDFLTGYGYVDAKRAVEAAMKRAPKKTTNRPRRPMTKAPLGMKSRGGRSTTLVSIAGSSAKTHSIPTYQPAPH